MRRLTFALIPAFAVACVALTGAQEVGGNAEARKIKNPIASTPASIEAGKASFKRACIFCHGPDGKGAPKPPPNLSVPPQDLTDAKWERGSTDGELFAVIRNGTPPKLDMKPNKALKDEEIWNIINFLRSIGPQTKK